MQQLFRNPTFTRLFLATFASQLGSTIGSMAFAFYMLDRFSTQPVYATVAELMYSLPTLAVFFIVGVCADRFDRQRIAEYTGWIRLALSVLLLGVIELDWVPVMFAILFTRSAVTKFYWPAESSMLQGVLDKEQYIRSSGLNQMIMGVFMLFGMSLGAIAYNFLGIQGAIMLDACGFLVSALLIRSCRIALEVRQPNGYSRVRDLKLGHVLHDFRDGIGYILNHKLLLTIIAGYAIFGLIDGAFIMLPMFTMKYKLAPDAYEWFLSMFAVSLGLGILLGSVITGRLVQKFKPHQVLLTGLMMSGLLILGLAWVEHPWVYVSLVFVTGMVLTPINIVLGGWMPELVEPTKMGRVMAWIDPVMMAGQSLTLGCIALFYPSVISLFMLYVFTGVLLLGVFTIYGLTLPRLIRQGKGEEGVPAIGPKERYPFDSAPNNL
ncbi:MFS transporter [Paenibacillus swuensis]|uniref:MFS transporter n=1 Tax=Paenibacillus swuensis TaxID=1178515 RepID=A0A172TI59_9BACL|nr:MFS transporter [Paenibacillus swuensis]ANE46584.1 MFS transporter [Paenibacillus swuensis]